MITRAPIIDSKMNLNLNQETLDRVYHDYQCGTFKIYNALVYHILLKVFTDMDAYVYVKQRKKYAGWLSSLLQHPQVISQC